jgi:outer membrane protein
MQMLNMPLPEALRFQFSFEGLRRLLLCLASGCLVLPALGQEHPMMTLENAIALGLKNNYDILIAKNEAAVSANDYSFAFGAFLPSLNGTASDSWSVTNLNQKYVSGTYINKNGVTSSNLDLAANLNWTLFDGLKVFATAKQLQEIKIQGALSVKNAVNNTVARIIDAYYNVVQQTQDLKSLEELMNISQQRLDIATKQFNVGSGSKLNMLQAQVDLNTEKEAYLQQLMFIDQGKSSLNQLLQIEADKTDYRVTDSIPVNLSLGYEALKTRIFTGNIPLQVLQKNVDIATQQLREAQANRWPVISFDPNYSYTLSQSHGGFLLYNQTKGLTYGFTATVPIFNQFNNSRLVRDSRLNIDYQRLTLDSEKTSIDLNLENAYDNYEYYKKALLLDEQNQGVASENVKVALASFQQAQTTMVDLRVAQQSFQDASYKLISDRYNVKVAETSLEQLQGDLVK